MSNDETRKVAEESLAQHSALDTPLRDGLADFLSEDSLQPVSPAEPTGAALQSHAAGRIGAGQPIGLGQRDEGLGQFESENALDDIVADSTEVAPARSGRRPSGRLSATLASLLICSISASTALWLRDVRSPDGGSTTRPSTTVGVPTLEPAQDTSGTQVRPWLSPADRSRSRCRVQSHPSALFCLMSRRSPTTIGQASSELSSGTNGRTASSTRLLLLEGRSGLSAGAELRAPTGSEVNLLGAGSSALKLLAIASAERGRLASHVNAGFVSGGAFREFDYSGAVTLAMSERLTLLAEVMGRRLKTPGQITELVLPHPTIAGVRTIRLVPDGTTLNSAIVATGFKLNLASTWLLGVHVSLAATDSGLRPRPTPMLALDYTFAN